MQLLESPIGKITEKTNEVCLYNFFISINGIIFIFSCSLILFIFIFIQIRFVISAIRYDLREGMDVLTTKITESGVSTVNISDKLMMIITIACCLIIVGLIIHK
jgi:hypothetical protein